MISTQSSPTREKILEIIKKLGKATVKNLTEELQITPMAIRGHLSKLEKEDLIQTDHVRQKLGRPLQVFSLTDKGDSFFPKQYGNFAVELLEDLQTLEEGKIFEMVIQRREDRIIEARKSSINNEESPKMRLQRYCELIEKDGYMPKIEEISEKSFLLTEGNCVVRQIASSFSFCCSSEAKVLSAIFPDATITKISNQIAGDEKCAYRFEFN